MRLNSGSSLAPAPDSPQAWSPLRGALRTLLLIPQVLPPAWVRPLEFVTAAPVRRAVVYPVGNTEGDADLYLPVRGAGHAALVLFLGVNTGGREDTRLEALAEALARLGIAVLLPWSESMPGMRVDPLDIDRLVEGVRYLQGLPQVDGSRVAMGGFCVGASIAAVAAADPRVRDEIRLVHMMGPYYDLVELMRAVLTRTRVTHGRTNAWAPNPLSEAVVAANLIHALPDRSERELLARLHREGDRPAGEERARLSSDGQVVEALLADPASDEVDSLLAALSGPVQARLKALSPRTSLGSLRAPILVLHDAADDLIPVDESRRMNLDLGPPGPVRYTEFTLFDHMTPTRRLPPLAYARELRKLWAHVYRFLQGMS